MVEGARLEIWYTSQGYRGFEPLPLRHVARERRDSISVGWLNHVTGERYGFSNRMYFASTHVIFAGVK